jgi:hypothetical protein
MLVLMRDAMDTFWDIWSIKFGIWDLFEMSFLLIGNCLGFGIWILDIKKIPLKAGFLRAGGGT